MTIGLPAILPNLSNGLENTGFLFGAGTSVEAGYPVMASLIRSVIAGLNTIERATFDEALPTPDASHQRYPASRSQGALLRHAGLASHGRIT